MNGKCNVEYFDLMEKSLGILYSMDPISALETAKEAVGRPGISSAYVRGEIPGNLLGPGHDNKTYSAVYVDNDGIRPDKRKAAVA